MLEGIYIHENEEIVNWLEDIWMMHRKNSRTRAESWEWIIMRWWAAENQTEKTPALLRMGEKSSHNRKKLWEDGMKLEPWILRERIRFGGKTLLRSSNVENDDKKHHHKLLRYSGMKIRKVEPMSKRTWKILERRADQEVYCTSKKSVLCSVYWLSF